MKRLALAAAALLVGLLAWLFWRSHDEAAGAIDAWALPASTPAAASRLPPPAAHPSAVPAAERSTLADTLNSPAADIRADLRVVAEIVAAFRSNFPHDGNPVGSNAEITATLTGRNSLHLAFIPPDHPAINGGRELCDRWGTPFFFHAESATRMEIRSAGPDRKMWTDDDVALTP